MALLRTGLLIGAAGLSGCVASKPLVINQAIGPERAVAGPDPQSGQLIVYSGWDGFDTFDSGHRKHTAYTVASREGGNEVHVRNQHGMFGENPEAVTLKPGNYLVRAHASNVGAVQVPVVIQDGQTTVVYLDGMTAPPASMQGQGTDWVRQPNGLIVGWADTVNRK